MNNRGITTHEAGRWLPECRLAVWLFARFSMAVLKHIQPNKEITP